MIDNAFIVHGGKPLKGRVALSGAKNISSKVMIASLLFEERVQLTNIPHLKDIHELIHLFEEIGVDVSLEGQDCTLDATRMDSHEVGLLHGSKIRVSFMMFAPFLHRFKKARIPNPGGCRIGARPIDRMISLIEAFGVTTSYDSQTGYYDAQVVGDALVGADFTFSKKTHTGTELAILCAVLAKGDSVIRNVALEPEIDDLIAFLNQAGGRIKRVGEEIHIQGVSKLTASREPYTIACDRNNAVTYAIFALATKGDVVVEGADASQLSVFIECLDAIGAGYEVGEGWMRFYYKGPLKAHDVTTQPEPGFMTDWQAPWAVLMTQAEGVSSVHETVFENRFGYAQELNKLGAHIEFYQPEVAHPHDVYQFDIKDEQAFKKAYQGIKIHGPSKLHGGVMHVTDMRAGATLIIGACIAQGQSVIEGASEVDRGYDDIEKKLTELGADIRRV